MVLCAPSMAHVSYLVYYKFWGEGSEGVKLLKLSLGIAFISIFILCVLLYNNIRTNNERLRALESKVDTQLVYHIGLAQSSFGVNFSEQTNLNERNYLYEKCIAEVAMVAALSEISSIEDRNDLIDVAFGGLYKDMLNTKFRDKVMKDQKRIYDILTKIMLNPDDE